MYLTVAVSKNSAARALIRKAIYSRQLLNVCGQSQGNLSEGCCLDGGSEDALHQAGLLRWRQQAFVHV